MQIQKQTFGTAGLTAFIIVFFIAFFFTSFFLFDSIINLLIGKNISVQDYMYR